MSNGIVFGAGKLHHLYTARERQHVVHAAYEIGLRAFDIAPAYGNGINETEIGIALRGKREGCEINTKYGIPIKIYGRGARHFFLIRRLIDKLSGGSASAYKQRLYSPKELENSLDQSLVRLQTDYVDSFFIHEPITSLSRIQLDEIFECAERMKEKGKIKAFGVAGPLASVHMCPSFESFDVIQVPFQDSDREDPALSDKDVILYGVYQAFLKECGDRSFLEFVSDKIKDHPGTRIIVSSKSVEVINSFRELIR